MVTSSTIASCAAPKLVTVVSLVLLPWAAFNLYTARARRIPAIVLPVHLVGDAAWVLASVVVLVAYAGGPSTIGLVLIAGQAAAVAGVFLIKLATRGTLA